MATRNSQAKTNITGGHVGGRALLIGVAVVTVVIASGVLLNDLIRIIYMLEGGYSLEVALMSDQGIDANLPGDTEQTTSQYWTVLISTYEMLAVPKLLQALAIGLTSLTFLAAAIAILLLCRRLWTGRTFATPAAVGLLVFAGLTLVTAWLAPWLSHRADTIALDELGYATSGGEKWVELHHFDIGSVNGAVLMLGVVLALTALVYLGTRRLQRDTEGLV